MIEVPLNIITPMQFTTDNTHWLVGSGTYMRIPRVEGTEPPESIDGALNHYEEVPYDQISYASDDSNGVFLHIIPSGRPEGARGVFSGYIRNVTIL